MISFWSTYTYVRSQAFIKNTLHESLNLQVVSRLLTAHLNQAGQKLES